jgi:nucleoside-diphosphate-sugar epimerase
MRRVLVTGATGFIGFEVAKRLSDLELRPRLLVRRPLRGPLIAALDAEPIQGDLGRPESLARALRGVDTVIHLAARAIFEEYDLVRPTIVDGSAALMRAALDAGVERFVYASSLLVYEGRADYVDATTPATSCLGYGRAKREAEQAMRSLVADSGMKLAVVRLPHVYGATDLMFEQMRRGRIISPGSGRNRFAHLHVADAARLLIGAAENDWSGVTPVADDEPASWREFFSVVRTYYPRFRQVSMPRWVALGGTRVLTPPRRLRGQPSLYTPDAVLSWNLELKVRPRLLWDDLGLEPLFPTIREGIPAVLDDCIAFRWVHPVLDRS